MPQTPQNYELGYYSAYPSSGCVTYIGFEILNKILEGLISSISHHKVPRNSFIIKGGIEITKCFWGNFGHEQIINLAICLKVIDGHQ